MPYSCQHGGTCINSTCVCSRGYKGSSCENESLEILYLRSSKAVFREGNEVLFESEITDNSNFTVQWSRDGVIISGILSRYSITSSAKANGTFLHQLRISSVYERDEGNWSIMASNGVTVVNKGIIIRVLPKLVLLMIPQYDLSIETKENFTLQCVVVNPGSLINLTSGSLIWVKDGKPLLTGSIFTISTTQTSTILNKASAEISDSGNYFCLHSTYPDPLNVSIYVNIIGPESVEILLFRISDSISREGKSVWLETEIYEIIDLTVQWFHNGNLITNSSLRYEIKSYTTENDTLRNVLNVPNVLQQDDGDWNITASNGKTTESMSVYLRVLPRLVLQMMPPNNISVESKKSINLSCVVTNPESLFNLSGGGLFWQKDGKKISPDSGFNITTTDTSTTLMKSSAEVDDSGTYLCAHSSYPEPIYVSIYINITEPSSGYNVTSGKMFTTLRKPSAVLEDSGTYACSHTASPESVQVTVYVNVTNSVLPRLVLQMMPPNNLSIESKESINLLCVVTNPESLFNLSGGGLFWQKDGKKISPDSGFNITTTDTSTTLNKLSAEEGDTGTYSCSHSAYPDPINVSLYINVTEPKSVEILSFKSSSSVLREGKSLRFESEIAFDPALIVQWFHNGKLINNSSKYTITSSITSNGTSVHVLQIFNVLLQDEGEWNITASNGKTSETKSIRIQVLEKLKLQMTPQYDFSIQRGEGIVLGCVVINPGSLQNLIGGSLIWQKDGQKILSGFHINTTNTSTQLRKSSSEIDDSGSYSCSHSAYPDPINVSINVNVTEPEPIEILSLKINKPLLIEGEAAWFESEIMNKSGLIVQWSHNGNLITDALSRFTLTSSTTANKTSLYVLNISSVVLQDEGEWNITATNGLSTASRGIKVQVFPRISLSLTPKDDLSIQTGEVIQLQCEALYTDTPAYSTGIKLNWKKDGKDISSDPSFSVSEAGTTTTLYKSSAELTDSGRYSCSHSAYSNPEDVSVYINVTLSDKDKPCPCQHGGTCINSTCVCPVGYQGRYCEDEYLEILSYKSSNSVIREEKSVWFQAEIVGPVGFSVQWSRNGDLISSTASRYVMTSSKTANGKTLHVLTITNVLQRDEGYWTVEALTSSKTEARNLTVKVLPRLLLQLAPQYDFSIKTGESINLRCVVINPKSLTGLSDGNLVWKKDGVYILSDFGFNISTTNVSSTLEKELAYLGDAGRFSCSHSTYPDPVSVSIAISVTKPEQIRCADDKIEKIMWKSTIAGTTKKESCPENQKGTATRYCNFQGFWESPDLINCTDVSLVNANEELDSIIADGTTKNVDEAVNNTLVKMKNLTSQRSELSAGDISSSLDILEKIVNVTNMTSANVEKEAFFAVVDNVLSTNNSKSWTAVSDKTEKDASSLLKNMDRMSEVVLKKENITTSKFKGKNFEVSVDKTKVDEKGIVFPEKTEKTPNDTTTDTEEYSTFLELPKQTNKIEKPITYVAVIYKTISDILPTDSGSRTEENSNEVKEGKEKKKKEFVNSEILSLTTQTDLGILSPPLNLAFQHKHENESADLQAVCVSWDFITNKWSEEGCKVNSTNNKRTVCQCNHLTNFAILMRPYTPVRI
ncbi:titin-like isoform X3 [Saccostrea cucullata]|uniref:titin-like isoform X3 n=1 Tax=Saccostrea cuccullata TaxID=36930 RepID=UPI002ED2B19B